jgi:Na+/H+ antiporter NhaC
MNLATLLLLALGVIVLVRIIFLMRRRFGSEKHTIRLEEAPSKTEENPGESSFLLILLFLLLASAVVVQFLLGGV